MARRDLTGALNMEHLNRFTLGDAILTEEVLGLFREQVNMWSRVLDPALPDQAWRDAAHTLKGAALGVGAFALAGACAEAEVAAERGPAARDIALAELRLQADRALADVAAWLHELALRSLKSPRA